MVAAIMGGGIRAGQRIGGRGGTQLADPPGDLIGRISPQPLDDLVADSTLSPHAHDCCREL